MENILRRELENAEEKLRAALRRRSWLERRCMNAESLEEFDRLNDEIVLIEREIQSLGYEVAVARKNWAWSTTVV